MFVFAPKDATVLLKDSTHISSGSLLYLPRETCVSVRHLSGETESARINFGVPALSPNAVAVNLKRDVLFLFRAPLARAPFSLLYQKDYGNLTVTVFRDGFTKISFDRAGAFDLITLPFHADAPEVFRTYETTGETFLFFFREKKRVLAYFVPEKDLKATLVLEGTADGVEIRPDGFSLLKTLSDVAGHKIKRDFTFDGNVYKETARHVQSPSFDPFFCKEELFPLCFLEEIVAGGDLSPYLSPELKGKTDLIFAYFNRPICAFLSPFSPTETGLLYPSRKKEYAFEARYATAKTENGKITNFTLSD